MNFFGFTIINSKNNKNVIHENKRMNEYSKNKILYDLRIQSIAIFFNNSSRYDYTLDCIQGPLVKDLCAYLNVEIYKCFNQFFFPRTNTRHRTRNIISNKL